MLKDLKEALIELFSSKKFITAVAGITVTLLAKIGLKADTETITSIVTIISLLLLGQAATDFGKAAKQAENDPKIRIIDKIMQSNPTALQQGENDKK